MLKNNRWQRRLGSLLLTFVILGAPAYTQDGSATVTKDKDGKAVGKDFKVTRQPTDKERIITRAVVQLLQRGHYSAKTRPIINDKASQQLFDAFFERLDPNKVYFLADDIEEFSPYRLILDDLLKRGELKFAFEVYDRFLKRVEERIEFARKRTQGEFSFDNDETMLLDRSKKPWPVSTKDLDEIWRKRIKNQMLIQEMIRNDAKKSGTPAPKKTPPQEVVLAYENYYKLLQANDTSDVMEMFLTTLSTIFDPHSSYMNWRHLEDFNIDMSLQLQGIGAVLTSTEGYVKIVRIIPGGPAEKDGRLKPGDRIVAVGQGDAETVNVVNMPLSKVVRLIRGKKGTRVRLTVIENLQGVPKNIDIVRDKVKLEDAAASGEVKVYGKNKTKVGHVYLPSFYADWEAIRRGDPNARSATNDIKKIVDNMIAKDKIEALIIDLRGDGGGSLDEAISLAGLFIKKGPVVQVKHSDAEPIIRRDEDDNFAYDLPLVVMIDRTSASASEIFAGAMLDYGRAVLIGDKQTHGKGTVQTVLRLKKFEAMRDLKPGALKYTMAMFFRVNGHSTQQKGVGPHIVLPSFFDHMDIGESNLDNVLPWDKIQPLQIDTNLSNVGPYLARVKAKSAERVASNKKFKVLADEIKRYGKRREMKTLTLNLTKREKLRKEDEYWSERMNEVLFRDSNKKPEPDDKKPDAEDPKKKKRERVDLYLDEAVAIATDLAELMATEKNK